MTESHCRKISTCAQDDPSGGWPHFPPEEQRSRLSPRSVLLLRRGVHRTPAPLHYNRPKNCFGIRLTTDHCPLFTDHCPLRPTASRPTVSVYIVRKSDGGCLVFWLKKTKRGAVSFFRVYLAVIVPGGGGKGGITRVYIYFASV